MTIPQEAIEAAARVMKPRQFEPNYTPLGIWSDVEQMHEIAELDRDMTLDRVRDIITAALPAIEKQIREQVAADIWEYWPFRRTARYREAACHSTGTPRWGYIRKLQQGCGVKTPATIAKENTTWLK